jgi:hypothetical protein
MTTCPSALLSPTQAQTLGAETGNTAPLSCPQGNAAPFQHQGQYYFGFADGTYCQYRTPPPEAGAFADVSPDSVGTAAGVCGPSIVVPWVDEAAPAPAAQVALNRGAVSLMLGGEPSFGFGFTAQCPGNVLPEFRHLLGGTVGLPVARISFPLADVYHLCASTGAVGAWNGGDPADPGSYDFTYLDSLLANAVSDSPDTRIILQVALDGSRRWVYAHPDCSNTPVPLVGRAPAGLPAQIPAGFACLSGAEQAQRMLQGIPDYLSQQWVSASAQLLQMLVAHIRASAYATNVVGYELMTGATLDNNFPVSYSSPQALRRFQSFLGGLYGSSDALASAWEQTGISFAIARPLTAEQGPSAGGCPTVPLSDPGLPLRAQLAPLLVPASFQAYTDSRAFTVEENQQVAFNFADAIKAATQGQAVVGVRSGEFPVQQVWCNQQANAVQWRTLDFFSHPSIDFYEVWEHYDSARFFGPAGGSGEPLMPVQGLAAFNKLYVVQNDFRVYDPQDPRADANPLGGWVSDYPGSIQKVRRVFVNALVNGMSEYLWQLGFHFDQPPLDPEWAQEQQIAKVAVKADRSRVSELAYVMDAGTGRYLADAYMGNFSGSPDPNTNGNTFFNEPGQQMYLTQFPTQAWARAGVPYDTIFLEQLATAKPYKVYVFFNTFGLSSAQAQAIRAQLSANHAVGIFVHADGMADGAGAAPLAALGTNVAALTGMPVQGSPQQRPAAITPDAAYLAAGGTVGDPGRWNFQPAAGIGLSPVTGKLMPGSSSMPMTPILIPSFSIDAAQDPSVTVLATYSRCGGSARAQDCAQLPAGVPAIAEKALPGGGDIIYSATPYLPPALIRYALARAGAFQYSSSEDNLYLDQSFVGLNTMDGSQRDGSVISNPRTAPIMSVPTASQTTADRTWSVTLRFPQATSLYDVFNHVEYPASPAQTLPVSADTTYLFYRGTQAAWQALGGQ